MKKILSIRFLVPLAIVSFVAFLLVYSFVTSQKALNKQILVNNINSMRDQMNYIQTSSQQLLSLNSVDNLQNLISSFASQPDIEILFITDNTGMIIASINFRDLNRYWSEVNDEVNYRLIQDITKRKISTVTQHDDYLTGLVSVCSNEKKTLRQKKCGFAYYKKNLGYHYAQAQYSISSTISYASAGLLVSGFILFLGLTIFLTRRANLIINALKTFTKGDRNVRLQIRGHDELASISKSINSMFDVICEKEEIINYKTAELKKVNAELEKYAETDALTEVYNRGYFDRALVNEIKRACRDKTPISLLMCDIDYFKLLNDTYGHQMGDKYLVKVAEIIKSTFSRAGDICTRYGGEEFAVILPKTDVEQAKVCAERLLKNVWEQNLPHTTSMIAERLTVSIGIATFQPTAQNNKMPNPKPLIMDADRALYLAKQNGRNRFEVKAQLEEVTKGKAIK